MKRRWISVLLCALLLAGLLRPVSARAAGSRELEMWLSEHPHTAYDYADDDILSDFADAGILTAQDLAYIGGAFTLTDTDTGETATLLIDLTGQAFRAANPDSFYLFEDEGSGEFGDRSGGEGGSYSESIRVGIWDLGEPGETEYDGFAEFCEDLEDARRSYENWLANSNWEDQNKQFETLTIGDWPAYVTTTERISVDDGSLYEPTGTAFAASYTGEKREEYVILLGEVCPGLSLSLEIEAEANVYAMGYHEDTIETAKATYTGICAELDKLVERYLSADYSWGYRLILADGTVVGTSSHDPSGDWSYDTDADEKGGVESGMLIPAAAVAVIGVAVIRGKRKKKRSTDPKKPERSNEPEPESDESEEDEEDRTRYAIRIYKDFGDTLVVGAEKQAIYARIVRIDPQGNESTDERLTSMIRISSPDYLQVTDHQRSGERMAAFICAPETAAPPEKAVVEFTVQSSGGRFTDRVHFKVESSPEITFFQENLTLPAVYDEVTLLPFSVAAGDTAEISAVIGPSGAYEVEVEEGDEPGLWYAKITETTKQTFTPGTIEGYTLHVTAKKGKIELTADLPVYRFHMGFKVDMGASIGCHFELKDEVWMSGGQRLGGAADYQPARTKVTLAVYDWDEEAHEVLVAAVTPGEGDVTLTALDPENQSKLDKLGVRLLYREGSATENGRSGTFICTEAVLDPPTCFKAKLNIHAAFNGKEYSYEREVIMASQRHRTTDEIAANADKDERVENYLRNLRDSIENSEDHEHLFPLAKYIGIMLDGYSNAYGYDEEQVARVQDIYSRYLRGELLGANAEAQTITFADELEMYISAFIDTGAAVEESLGFWGNLAVGVISLGHSDAIFATFKAAKAMKDYVARGGDSAWGAFFVGAASATGDYLMSKATDAAVGAAVGGAKLAGKEAAALARKLSPKTVGSALDATEQAIRKTKDYLSDKVGKKVKSVLEKSKGEKAKVKSQVEADIRSSNAKPMSADDLRLEALESSGNKAAKVKLDDLEAARQVAEQWPTTENMDFYRKKVLEVQQDKFAMYQLKTRAGADDLRASFNREMKSIYESTDRRVRQYFESQGTPLRKNVQSATNSSAAALEKGQTVTMDRDITYYAEDGGLLKQGEAQAAYERAFYKETKGIDPPSDEAAHAWAKLNDQSVVQKASAENYGNQHDLDAMLKDHGEDLINPDKVGKVVSDKGLEWMKEGQSMIDRGKSLSDPQLGESLIKDGLKLRKEGMRQITKQYRYVDARDISKACQSGQLKISEDLRYGVEMFSKTFEDGPTHISVAKCESLLREKGLTLEEVAVALGRITTLIG